MKNQVSYTFWLVLCVTVILMALYFLPVITWHGKPFRKVDMLSALRFPEPEELIEEDSLSMLSPPVKPIFVDSCKTGLTCIEDYSDSTMRGMNPFYEALAQMDTLSRAVRIAYFGDSFIEGDILTAHLRSLLQTRFGGSGVGFVDITSIISGFRPTVRHTFGGWDSHSSTDTVYFDRSRQGISGRYFYPYANSFVELRGEREYLPHLDTCEASSLYFLAKDSLELYSRVNGGTERQHKIKGAERVQRCEVNGDIGRVRWRVGQSKETVFFGLAMDDKEGISVDNFSLRGSSGLSLRSIPAQHLKQFNALRPYDLIVLQYGLNVATERGVNYDRYYKGMQAAIAHLKAAFPQAGILVVGVGDRAYRRETGELRTMPGVKNLIRYQQRLAAEEHVAFWNLYEAMGGEGSISTLVEAKPSMANLDYTHINFRGGKHLAGILYEVLIYGMEQHERRKAYEAEQ